ncbi:uncharacterized protein EI90DRAFT_3088864 [Cantharellus anzutake]|uniref:uncharacterized protein n=1 Tax=Cantharellus anzutake TaxID=1750568 RepID=UPI00190405A0|nr:uncharacterized protein EI90DRAFT_3088864 [Cantharellus anzutake]KAF8315080.1 hypothetical protein EI90DRAFT_3088864 [Cantharellus anzutake]
MYVKCVACARQGVQPLLIFYPLEKRSEPGRTIATRRIIWPCIHLVQSIIRCPKAHWLTIVDSRWPTSRHLWSTHMHSGVLLRWGTRIAHVDPLRHQWSSSNPFGITFLHTQMACVTEFFAWLPRSIRRSPPDTSASTTSIPYAGWDTNESDPPAVLASGVFSFRFLSRSRSVYGGGLVLTVLRRSLGNSL